jgi:uracil phosphoribosyltransferase
MAAEPTAFLESPTSTAVIAPFSKTRRIKHADSDGTDALPVLDGRVLPAQRPAPARRVNVVEHPIASHALTGLRNRQTAPEQFRAFSNQLLVLLTMESTRTLPAREETVDTMVGPFGGRALGKPVVFLSLSRHGLGLVHNAASFVPGALVGMINLGPAGNSQAPDPRLHLVNAPALGGVRVILFDPVVATGLSATLSLDLLRRSGAVDISLLSFLVSGVGLERVQGASPDLAIWTAAIDTEWDSKRGPLPGLGNFGERLYGN